MANPRNTKRNRQILLRSLFNNDSLSTLADAYGVSKQRVLQIIHEELRRANPAAAERLIPQGIEVLRKEAAQFWDASKAPRSTP